MPVATVLSLVKKCRCIIDKNSLYLGMKKIILNLFFLFALFLFPKGVAAAVSPLAVAILPPLQFPSDEFSITGARLSFLWGHHRDLYGIDLGVLGNITDQEFTGLALSGAFNYTKGTTTILGLQFAGLANINNNKTSVYGLQMALGLNSNTATSTVVGVQAALLGNLSPFTDIYGVQLGLYNKAMSVYGLQIGLVNFTSNLHGVQIGLVNFNSKGPFVVSPILNVGF